jgi:hypothetical protein
VRCCADAAPWNPSNAYNADGTPQLVNLVKDLAHGTCHDDVCMEKGALGQPGSCALTTRNRNGDNMPGLNGIRHCGAASQSTIGWGGEPGRAIDGKKCTTYGERGA